MSYRTVLSCSLLVLCGCSASIHTRSELIRPYSYAAQKNEPFPIPYVAKYQKGKKSLVYIAASHGSELEGPTFKTIQSIFTSFKPEAVIIEGVEFAGQYSPNFFTKYAKKCAAKNFRSCSESAYSAYLALGSNIPFIPSELRGEKIAQALAFQGYQEKEYWLLLAGEMILQYKRQAPEKLNNLNQSLLYDAKVSLDEFRAWYQEKSGHPFSLQEVNSETFSPRVDKQPTYFNKITAVQSIIREKFILERIQEAISKFDKVLVVFGAGHLVIERDVLNDAFGSSKNVKLFPKS